jgi:Arc/MetJ family transcription regulator
MAPPMTVTNIDIDESALERVMTLSGTRTKKDAVNLALAEYVSSQERARLFSRFFERAEHWEATENAERRHNAEKQAR